MSKAGVQSNRGDHYQTLVALEWVMKVIFDPNYEWIEVDSTSLPVDDIVIGKTNGEVTCIQCKKNQPQHQNWSFKDLESELTKAILVKKELPTAKVVFYSRTAFGKLAALAEYSRNYTTIDEYQENLPKSHQTTHAEIKTLLEKEKSSLCVLVFLQSLRFVNTNDFDHMEEKLKNDLKDKVTNHNAAYDALWKAIDDLGAREADDTTDKHKISKLTKSELKNRLAEISAHITPPFDIKGTRKAFTQISSIGRSWHRDIAGKQFPQRSVDDVICAIDQRTSSILLTGAPGAGKTCAMLSILEHLESNRPEILPLFIQAREFASTPTIAERQAIGLPETWVNQAIRAGESQTVVVLVDSLDVLSIARDHGALNYFLAQIDQLLSAPNVTIVVACREFDRQYDYRIASRKWEKEISCHSLSWSNEVEPWLVEIGIDTETIDTVTKNLILNPRELSLFSTISRESGTINVGSSQVLAKRYLTDVILRDENLGDAAMLVIENLAKCMLRQRSLHISQQSVSVTKEMMQRLLSHNILIETHQKLLTFGHQSLVDVLVVNNALREDLSFQAFIDQLPAVPFVRPTIRAFLYQLAAIDRKQFRRQIRPILTGNSPFHIRRLIAETYAEYPPDLQDWSLLRELKNDHSTIFQIIYHQASNPEWHTFWMQHLLPLYKESNDQSGILNHALRVIEWVNVSPESISDFWLDCLELYDEGRFIFTHSIPHAIADKVNETELPRFIPLLKQILTLPRKENGYIGHALARAIKHDLLDEKTLWLYITQDVTPEDFQGWKDQNNLHCSPHEFDKSNNDFLKQGMIKSTALLNLAIHDIERWSQIKRDSIYDVKPPSYWDSFLDKTSHTLTHSDAAYTEATNLYLLLDAIEAAVKYHAHINSAWWLSNRERLTANHESSLRYFSIIACLESPTHNLDFIGRLLSDHETLESNKFWYQMGLLNQKCFVHLNSDTQCAIENNFLTIHSDSEGNERYQKWLIERRVLLLNTIPCHLRSIHANQLVSAYQHREGVIELTPPKFIQGGTIRAPFSYETILTLSHANILKLLNHYDGYLGDRGDDWLSRGYKEVGNQLSDAASRAPWRFIQLLKAHWQEIPHCFYNDMLRGCERYLAYKYGNSNPNGEWNTLEEPDPALLAQKIISVIELHPQHWHHNRTAAEAIEACAPVVQIGGVDRLVSLAQGFINYEDRNPMSGDRVSLLNLAINMAKGDVVAALMKLSSHLEKLNHNLPPSLVRLLRQFAATEHPAIRAILLEYLPSFQTHHQKLGWELFTIAMQQYHPDLWEYAERCLYYAYHNNYKTVAFWLNVIWETGQGKDFEVWARMSALCALSGHMDTQDLTEKLINLNSEDAWKGAAKVWTNASNFRRHPEQCEKGLQAGLKTGNKTAHAVAIEIRSLFSDSLPTKIPVALLLSGFNALSKEDNSKRDLLGIDKWLNHISIQDPLYALDVLDKYLAFLSQNREKATLHDYQNHLTQLLTRLFAEAEEQEEVDGAKMLNRVIKVQDKMLELGVTEMDKWMKAAERP